MCKRKLLALLLSGGFMLALGLNCLPNIGGTQFTDCISGLFGGAQ
jgi:hypothetical protein